MRASCEARSTGVSTRRIRAEPRPATRRRVGSAGAVRRKPSCLRPIHSASGVREKRDCPTRDLVEETRYLPRECAIRRRSERFGPKRTRTRDLDDRGIGAHRHSGSDVGPSRQLRGPSDRRSSLAAAARSRARLLRQLAKRSRTARGTTKWARRSSLSLSLSLSLSDHARAGTRHCHAGVMTAAERRHSRPLRRDQRDHAVHLRRGAIRTAA
jgi:hypothetical protein